MTSNDVVPIAVIAVIVGFCAGSLLERWIHGRKPKGGPVD
jgi:hypothetical protein